LERTLKEYILLSSYPTLDRTKMQPTTKTTIASFLKFVDLCSRSSNCLLDDLMQMGDL
jgi:hypothetical protein